MLPIVFIAGEGPEVQKLLFEDAAGWSTFLWGTLLTVSAMLKLRWQPLELGPQGLFGFLICIAGFLSIKVTSPITHMVSSAVRGVVVTILGVWLFQDIITTYVFSLLLGAVFEALSQGSRRLYHNNTDGINILHLGQERGSESERCRKRANKWTIWKSSARRCRAREEGSTIDCSVDSVIRVGAFVPDTD